MPTGSRPSGDDYVFASPEGKPIGSFKKSFASLLKSAKVEKDSHGNHRTIYSLRHTYATFRLQEGVHQFILARNMGTSTAMLEKHYGHTSNVASAAEMAKSGRLKGGESHLVVEWLGCVDKVAQPQSDRNEVHKSGEGLGELFISRCEAA